MRAIFRQLGSVLAAPLCWLTACGSPKAPPQSPVPATAPAGSETHTLQDRSWGVLRSPALGIKLALPEAKAWLSAPSPPAPGAGWDLRHEPTGTALNVRRWRASRLPRIDACEVELRERTQLPLVDETNLVSQREVRVPEGFVTRITLVVGPGGAARVSGQAFAIAAGVGECIAAVAHTECASEVELAERLRLLDATFAHLRLTQIEDRVPTPQPNSP